MESTDGIMGTCAAGGDEAMKPILSIGIPTYNRAKLLKWNLESLYGQKRAIASGQVEVLVSNNASTDDTDAVVQSYIEHGLPITYFCNVENIGPDGNFLQCIAKAQGKYVRLLGDDDLLLDGAVDALVKILSQEDYGVVYISGIPYERRREKAPAYEAIDVKNETFHEPNKFMRKESYYITFMSGNIFNKEHLPPFQPEQYRGTSLIQVPFYLYALCHAKRNLYLKEPFLAVGGNGDNNGGYGLYQVFGVNLFDMLTSFEKEGLRADTIRAIADDILVNFFPFFIVIAREKENFIAESLAVMEKYHGENWRYRYICKPLFSLPLPLAKGYLFLLRCLRKIRRIAMKLAH